MPAPYGVVPTGFSIKSFTEIRQSLRTLFINTFGADLAVGDEFIGSSLVEILIGNLANEYSEPWEALQAVWANSYPDMATGSNLDHAVSLVGVGRQEATYSSVIITLTNTDTSDHLFIAGSLVAQSSTGQQWETLVDINVPASSTADVGARPIIKGAILAVPSSIDTVVTVVTGLTSVDNVLEATVGFDRETNEELRISKTENILISRGGILPAVLEAVGELSGITYVAGLLNDTDFTDLNGLLPHSIEVTVGGSGFSSVEVAETIAATKGAGINTNGATSEIITTSFGQTLTIRYETVSSILVYFDVTVTTDSNYPVNGDTLIADALVSFGENLGNGETLYRFQAGASIGSVPGVTSVDLRLNKTDVPITETADLTFAPDERAFVDASNITVNS